MALGIAWSMFVSPTILEGIHLIPESGFRDSGSGHCSRGLGCKVLSSGFRVPGSGFRVPDSGFRVQVPGSRLQLSGPGPEDPLRV